MTGSLLREKFDGANNSNIIGYVCFCLYRFVMIIPEVFT